MLDNRNGSMLPSEGDRRGSRMLLASSAARSSHMVVGKSRGLPGEGTVYDHIGIANFIDLEKNKLTASISKSFRTNILSRWLDSEMPSKITVGGKLGNVWLDGFEYKPVGKVAMTVQLLDLGATDSRQTGFLRFKAATRTNGLADAGFEVDRKVAVLNFPSTCVYGNVSYRTTNRSSGNWKTSSSFGIHQAFRFAGLRCAVRAGMTPEGEFVYDLRL